MLKVDRSIFRAPALSLASQIIGMIQLFVLLWRYGATNATDAYFYLFNLGNLPSQILLVGVLYPMLLNDQKISRRSARLFGAGVSLVGIAAVGVGALWLFRTGRVDPDIVPIIGFSAANAFFQCMLWYRAVAAEAGGVPQWVSAIALPANLLATLVILLPWSSSTSTVTAMTAALAAANCVLFLVMTRLKVGRSVIESLPETPAERHNAPWWFLSKSAVAYGGLMVIQSASLVLPPSTLTLLTVPMKIVASVSATFTNAILPRLIHQKSTSPESGRYFLQIAAVILGGVGSVTSLIFIIFFEQYAVIAVVVSLWLVSSAAASVAQRLAFRFLKPSASRVTIGVVPVIVVATLVSAKSENFGLVPLLCAYATVDGVTATLLLVAIKDRVMAGALGLVTFGLCGIWMTQLLN